MVFDEGLFGEAPSCAGGRKEGPPVGFGIAVGAVVAGDRLKQVFAGKVIVYAAYISGITAKTTVTRIGSRGGGS